MKKILISIAAVAALLCSCSKEIAAPVNENTAASVELVPMTFTASVEATRTAFSEGLNVAFKPGEKIAVFADGDTAPYEFTTTEGGAAASFTGSAPSASKYYAMFPYSAALTCESGVIKGASMTKSSEGCGVGSYYSQKAFAVAVTDSDVFAFKQVCALLKVTVPTDVTDLKEVVVFSRDGALTSAINGSFDVAVGTDGTPTVSVTSTDTPSQVGIVGPDGSTVAMPAGDYYIPVLPAVLPVKKGLDLKINFLDSFVARAFNGKAITLQPGKVYNLGTIRKTDEFVENGFETKDLTKFTGNNNGSLGSALSVVENPYKTATNPSDWVLKDDMSQTTTGTSGYVEIQSNTEALLTRFPSAVRGFYDKIRVKVYLGANQYYPRIKRASITPPWPAKINGVALDGADNAANKLIWDANVKTDDWNVLEWNASQMESSWTSFANLQTYNFRPFLTWDGQNWSGFDATTNNRCVYFDDITFVLK